MREIIIGVIVAVIVLYIGLQVAIPVQWKLMCKFCNETNWKGIAKGEITFKCEDWTEKEKLECYEKWLK